MFTKTGLLALCAAASFNGATAAHHRHRHPNRDVVYAETDVVVVTEYETHTVTAGQEQPTTVPTTTAVPTSSQVAAENVPVVAPTTTEAPAPAPTTPTTLATLVKPSPATTSSSPPAADVPAVAPAAATAAQLVSSIVGDITTPLAVPAPAETSSAAAAAVATSAASPAEVAPASTTPSSSKASKRGAAYNDASMVKMLLGQSSAISWVYNWGTDAGDLDVDIPFYPTMWGDKDAADWPAKALSYIAKGTEVFFSMNEPDNAGQANMSPSYAATKYQEWMNPYADSVRIGAPAVSSSEEPNQGLDWLTQFFSACGGSCKVDFCNTHWYGPGGDAGADLFLNHVKAVRDVSGCQGKPVWITEFMPMGSTSDNETFMKRITEALESSEFDFVEKYSYFMLAVGDSYLLSSATELNALGKIYANLS